MRKLLIPLVLLIGALLPLQAFGQSRKAKMAKEYYRLEKYENARSLFQELLEQEKDLEQIYEDYLALLKQEKDWDQAEKLIKEVQKNHKELLRYELDLIGVYAKTKPKKADRRWRRFVRSHKDNPAYVRETFKYYMERSKYGRAEEILKEARKAIDKPSAFAPELIKLYSSQGETEKMLQEVFVQLESGNLELEKVQNMLQSNLRKEEDFDRLERLLYQKVKDKPGVVEYNHLLCWLYLQKQNYDKAFIQARAIDKRSPGQEPNKLMEVAGIAMENRRYKEAIEIYHHITANYANTSAYPKARKRRINAKEALVKNRYPIPKDTIHSLIADYRNLMSEVGKKPSTIGNLVSMAKLYGFYLDQQDTAIAMLEQMLDYPRGDQKEKAYAKLTLGDMYLLRGEPWEATLIYSQVEKAHKQTPIAHDAKLRNAKLHFYKGDFKLSQGHLDILKKATSREIANDAMDLSLLIRNNLALDTTEEALQMYADAQLLLFQRQDAQAIQKMDSLLKRFDRHSLTDEILYEKAKLYRKRKKYEEALRQLERIRENYPEDILGDNALFLMAKIKEENLQQDQQAQKLYKKMLMEYPGSFYAAESRKRFRKLRGDQVNP